VLKKTILCSMSNYVIVLYLVLENQSHSVIFIKCMIGFALQLKT